ncbi:MAG TPA: hypothetical protein DCP71_11805 [Verrucomicrobiales bacterium]|nr:hypothetical protein [Verrucomicrobiales bacterium]
MQEFLCSVARGVYFYEKYEKLIVPLKVTNIGNDFSNFEKNIILKKRERHFDSEIGDAPVLGENPKVFNYSIQVKSNGIKLVRLVFYGNLKYWVFYLPQLNG